MQRTWTKAKSVLKEGINDLVGVRLAMLKQGSAILKDEDARVKGESNRDLTI